MSYDDWLVRPYEEAAQRQDQWEWASEQVEPEDRCDDCSEDLDRVPCDDCVESKLEDLMDPY